MQAQLQKWASDLNIALNTRNIEPSLLVGIGRKGFHDEFRPAAWKAVLGAGTLSDSGYEALLAEAFGTARLPTGQTVTPSGELDFASINLSPEQAFSVIQVLHVLSRRHPQLEVVPIFPAICGILAVYYAPKDVYACLEAVIKQASAGSHYSASKDWPFFPHNRRESLIFNRIFEDLIGKFLPNLTRHVLRVQQGSPNFNPRWHRLLSDLFIGILPRTFVLRTFDCYLIEGFKVLIRFALAHLALLQPRILESKTAEDFFRIVFKSFSEAHEPYTFKLLQKTAFGFKFSRTILVRFKSRHRKWSLEDFEENDKVLMLQRPLPKVSRPSNFLTDSDWSHIWSWIPPRYKIMDLELVFVSSEQGHRLASLYEACEGEEPLILVVETTEGDVFGAYLSKSLRGRSTKRFFGTGETFLFSIRPNLAAFSWSDSHNNQQFIYGDQNFLAVGCSAGKFGIWLDRDLNQVVSSPCDTFKNPAFIDTETGWADIYCVEAYRFK
jgi:hypothetical protein